MDTIEKTLSSLEVAEMVGKEHSKLLRDIREYISQLGQANIGQSEFFTESTYQNSQNKTQPCYQVTKKGCEFIAHKLTGTKGTEFTAKYINKFHDMEQAINKPKSLSPQLQLMQNLINQMAEQELAIQNANSQSQQALEKVDNIKEVMLEPIGEWRKEINDKVRKIGYESGIAYRDLFEQMYARLELIAGCNLKVLKANKTKRLTEQGRSKSYIKMETTCLAIINDNKRLKEIFTNIVKEYSIKYLI